MSYSAEDAAIVTKYFLILLAWLLILETKNFYEILEVPNDATVDNIKAAHKKLALKVHPDKNHFPKAKDAFVAVRKATAVLLDKNTREEYDSYLSSPRGFCTDKFDLSDDAVDAILVTAGIASIVGIAAGLWALYEWFTSPKKKENQNESKYAK